MTQDRSAGADHQVIELPAGATIEVRPTSSDDGELLAEIYDQLSDRDVYRRFFTGARPGDRWAHEWADVSERGGFGVIAIHHESDGTPGRPIAEAGYAIRTDGDGDLAITVLADRRGWLGGFLLEVLVDHARRAGVQNLQAEVLLENRPMLGLLRHRGAVNREHARGIVRVSIATDGDVPSWSPLDARPRILVEVGSGRWAGEEAAERAGFAVALCPGPERRRGSCPALDGRPCPLVEGADAVVVARDPDDVTTHALIRAHQELDPAIPVFVRQSDPASSEFDNVFIASDDVDDVVADLRDATGGGDAQPTVDET